MSRSLDRLTLLETFVRIAERGTISAAASDLGLSQASASRQLADLEGRLGVELITRTTHSLALTKAGELCLRDARLLLAEWDGFTERFEDEAATISGSLKVVAPVALGQTVALDCALAFQKDHPGITLDWILEDGPIRFSEVGCDLWLKIGHIADETLIVQPLAEVERLIVAAPGFEPAETLDHPRALEGLPCAAIDPFEGARVPLTGPDGGRFDLKAEVAFTTNNILAARQAALAGNAYAVLPRWLIDGSLNTGQLTDLLPQWRAPTLKVQAAFAPSRRQTKRLRMFVAAMRVALEGLHDNRMRT